MKADEYRYWQGRPVQELEPAGPRLQRPFVRRFPAIRFDQSPQPFPVVILRLIAEFIRTWRSLQYHELADPTKDLIWIVMFERDGKGNPDSSNVRIALQEAATGK
jgi:hypothetical protein